MPTIDQLSAIWETQFEFFGGFGHPKANYIGSGEGSTEGMGLTSLRHTDLRVGANNGFSEFTGEQIGEMKVNEQTGDIKIVYNLD